MRWKINSIQDDLCDYFVLIVGAEVVNAKRIQHGLQLVLTLLMKGRATTCKD
jgi:hypothetical protein